MCAGDFVNVLAVVGYYSVAVTGPSIESDRSCCLCWSSFATLQMTIKLSGLKQQLSCQSGGLWIRNSGSPLAGLAFWSHTSVVSLK